MEIGKTSPDATFSVLRSVVGYRGVNGMIFFFIFVFI